MLRFSTAVPAAIVFFAAGLLLWGCAGPEPASRPPESTEDSPEPEIRVPPYEALVADEHGIHLLRLPGDDRVVLLPRSRPTGFESSSPSADRFVFSFARGDSSHLALFEARESVLRSIYSTHGEVTFTGAWSPTESAFAFAVRGSGADTPEVHIYHLDGRLDQVGCSASTIVEAWPSAERLVTGDGQRLYVVATDGCDTFSSQDARKMHHIAFSPKAGRMAYILRDLTYDRGRRQYVPDSSLYVARYDGSEASMLFDYEYRPRHLSWSSDGSLAFDVRDRDDPDRRRIVLYDTTSGDFIFLVAPDAFPEASDVRPIFSPTSRTWPSISWTIAGCERPSVRSAERRSSPQRPILHGDGLTTKQLFW